MHWSTPALMSIPTEDIFGETKQLQVNSGLRGGSKSIFGPWHVYGSMAEVAGTPNNFIVFCDYDNVPNSEPLRSQYLRRAVR